MPRACPVEAHVSRYTRRPRAATPFPNPAGLSRGSFGFPLRQVRDSLPQSRGLVPGSFGFPLRQVRDSLPQSRGFVPRIVRLPATAGPRFPSPPGKPAAFCARWAAPVAKSRTIRRASRRDLCITTRGKPGAFTSEPYDRRCDDDDPRAGQRLPVSPPAARFRPRRTAAGQRFAREDSWSFGPPPADTPAIGERRRRPWRRLLRILCVEQVRLEIDNLCRHDLASVLQQHQTVDEPGQQLISVANRETAFGESKGTFDFSMSLFERRMSPLFSPLWFRQCVGQGGFRAF